MNGFGSGRAGPGGLRNQNDKLLPLHKSKKQSTGFGMVHSGIRAVKMGSWGRNERFWAPKGRNNHSQAFEWQGLGLRGFQWNGSKRNIYGVGMTMHDRFGLLEDPGVGVAGAGMEGFLWNGVKMKGLRLAESKRKYAGGRKEG